MTPSLNDPSLLCLSVTYAYVYLVHGEVGAEGDVLGDREAEQHWLLRHDCYLLVVPFTVQVLDVLVACNTTQQTWSILNHRQQKQSRSQK